MKRNNNMLRIVFLVSFCLLSVLAGCGTDLVAVQQDENPLVSPQDKGAYLLSPSLLLEHYQKSLEVEYHSFEGVYTPGTIGIFAGSLTSWPGEYSVGLQIPEDALPLHHDPVNISLQVPKYLRNLPDEEQPPLVIIIDFGGVELENAATVLLPNAPWLESPEVEPIFWVYTMVPEYSGEELISVGYSGLQSIGRGDSEGPEGMLVFKAEGEGRTEMTYQVPGDQSDDLIDPEEFNIRFRTE